MAFAEFFVIFSKNFLNEACQKKSVAGRNLNNLFVDDV